MTLTKKEIEQVRREIKNEKKKKKVVKKKRKLSPMEEVIGRFKV